MSGKNNENKVGLRARQSLAALSAVAAIAIPVSAASANKAERNKGVSGSKVHRVIGGLASRMYTERTRGFPWSTVSVRETEEQDVQMWVSGKKKGAYYFREFFKRQGPHVLSGQPEYLKLTEGRFNASGTYIPDTELVAEQIGTSGHQNWVIGEVTHKGSHTLSVEAAEHPRPHELKMNDNRLEAFSNLAGLMIAAAENDSPTHPLPLMFSEQGHTAYPF